MRVTQLNYMVFRSLEGSDWQSASEIAKRLGTEARNLKTTLAKLIAVGVIESNDLVRPVLYRLVQSPSESAQQFVDQIRLTAPIFENRRVA